MPTEDPGHDLLLRELGRINSELAAQRRLSAMVAHDLATPTQVILGLSEVLVDHPGLAPDLRSRIEQLHRSALTLSSLVGDLGRGMAIDTHTSLELRRLELNDLVGSVADRSRLVADAKNMSIVFRASGPGEDCWVDADEARLDRALSNLIGNAVKFSPDGSSVAVGVRRERQYGLITVSDEGPGISAEGKSRIFEVFHREAGTAHLPGLGLGLHITREIAEGHGGHIEVDSEPGRGATFALRIPLALGDSLTETG